MASSDRQRRTGFNLIEPVGEISPPPKRSRAARAYDALRRWADQGWANSAVFAWGVLQGTIVPSLADVFFLPLALAQPARAYILALSATAGTLVGSMVLFVFGATALSQLTGSTAEWLGVSAGALQHTRDLLAQYGWLVILASTMSPISTKLTSIASGAFGVPWLGFVLALGGGRLFRTMAEAWLVRHGGARTVARWMSR